MKARRLAIMPAAPGYFLVRADYGGRIAHGPIVGWLALERRDEDGEGFIRFVEPIAIIDNEPTIGNTQGGEMVLTDVERAGGLPNVIRSRGEGGGFYLSWSTEEDIERSLAEGRERVRQILKDDGSIALNDDRGVVGE